MGKKYQMPTSEYFFSKKTFSPRKSVPVWVYLEEEMIINIDRKPYNKKVGDWLKFLKDLKYYFFCKSKRKYKTISKGCGPSWFVELSPYQCNIIHNLQMDIRGDLVDRTPVRVTKALKCLGLMVTFPKHILMHTLKMCQEDTGLFLWYLYEDLYKSPPYEARPYYDLNAQLLMSSMVALDYDDCIKYINMFIQESSVEKVTQKSVAQKTSKPNTKYGEYLQPMTAPMYFPAGTSFRIRKKPPELLFEIKDLSAESLDNLLKLTTFMQKRIDKNKLERPPPRVCNYPFWKPPPVTSGSSPKEMEMYRGLKMLMLKPKRTFLKSLGSLKLMDYTLGGVSYSGRKPNFIHEGVHVKPAPSLLINGGFVLVRGELIINIIGYREYPREEDPGHICECEENWERSVQGYLENTKCRCKHFYDFNHKLCSCTGYENFFLPPTRRLPGWFNQARIYLTNPKYFMVQDALKHALLSGSTTTPPPRARICAADLQPRVLLGVLLAKLAETELIIPHLPDASDLLNLKEYVRKRFKGPIPPNKRKRLIQESARMRSQLCRLDFKAKAYFVPFTFDQIRNMNWSHRFMVKDLVEKLLNDFILRNKLKLLDKTRLMFPTFLPYQFPTPTFLDTFFTYMPGRINDIYIINPPNLRNLKFVKRTNCHVLEKFMKSILY